MKIVVIDNYDSFTYNLVHIVEKFAEKVEVYRTHEIPAMAQLIAFDGIIISPGPGLPSDYPQLFTLLTDLPKKFPVLGVCLGLQTLAMHFGANLTNLSEPLHGRAVEVTQIGCCTLFTDIPQKMLTARYHSWVIDKDTLPACLEITATDAQETIQAARHNSYPWQGVQFHPESILTTYGERMLKNWINSLA